MSAESKRRLIFCTDKDKLSKTEYTRISNTLLQGNLSMQEQSVLTYLLSKSPTWCANTKQLARHYEVSIGLIKKIFKSLSDKGYMRGWRVKTGRYVYEVFEEPLTPKQMNARRTRALEQKKP